MSTINPYQDIETRRQYRNRTNTQQKNLSEMKEGIVVNALIRDPGKECCTDDCPNISNMYDSLVIPDKMTKPDSFDKKVSEQIKEGKEKPLHRSLIPLMASTVGMFALVAGSMYGLRKFADYKKGLEPWQNLQEITKHVSVNDEPHLAMLLMIRDPNYRNVMGALGVFVLSGIGLVGKNFVDGVKDIWVRKKQADVQRDLQEKLIAVETKSFSGKMQILRNMLTEKARELDTVLHKNNVGNENTTFKKFISFKKSNKSESFSETQNLEDKKKEKLLTGGILALTTVLIGLLARFAFKNLRITAQTCEASGERVINNIKKAIENSESATIQDLEALKNTLVSLNYERKDIEKLLNGTKNIPQGVYRAFDGKEYESYAKYVIMEAEKLTDEGAQAIAGKPSSKPVIFSYTGDLCSHLYNMIVNPKNTLLKMVFAGMTAVSGIGYSGTKTVEAMKEAQVIKENANTELDLQKRLVSVELKNFETKKRSVIEPLVDEFRVQAMQGKDKNELKTRAENILYEIKNGPPFVYS